MFQLSGLIHPPARRNSGTGNESDGSDPASALGSDAEDSIPTSSVEELDDNISDAGEHGGIDTTALYDSSF